MAKAGRKPIGPSTLDERCRLASVTRATLIKWRDTEGLDIYDDAALLERAGRKERGPKNSMSEDEREAKRRKTVAEADMIEHKLAVQRGEYVRAIDQRNEGMRIGNVVKGVLLRMRDDLPPLLAGRTAAEVKTALIRYTADKLTELSLYESPIKITIEEEP